MGVPKFFRWISERYPAISQLIAENRIPEFDCLYLDMNGIIHNCTHKDSDDVHFRLSEEEMFIAIFNYIEHLFGKIKPKKLFFMAIDGVAPRAKMNQQRARRFRTALDAEKARDKAIREGKELPKEEPFDSNCITPGTEFMAKLSQQLKYFINKKVSEDREWQGPEIVLSGHEVPGEGEHKIMEYIRNARAQPDYNPNVRHCLYGLDADLIMLGLLSHDPHFCLLREEVTFGRQSKSKSKELEHQNFYLMHLCIVREYLELEFQDLKKEGAMRFPFDMERVIDDFILMAFFVGNDFLPNLPRLHINEGALATMFRIYKQVLPKCDGYINEGGKVNLPRLGLLLEELGKEEYRFFEHEHQDSSWLRGKRLLENDEAERSKAKAKGKLVVTTAQKDLWKRNIRKFFTNRVSSTLDLGTELKAEDRKFVQDLADAAHISWATKEDDEGHRHLILSFPEKEDEDEEDEEAQSAVLRIVRKYDNAQVLDLTAADAQAAMEAKYKEKFQEWKDKYYLEKFEDWTPENKEDELRKLTENYIQGLQWVLYYYYRGIASWPWFYRYHYSPMISDIMKGLNADLNFKLGQPFRPNEQLMGVLPDRSKKIVPKVYHELMTDPKSPIIDFYPRDFELDMNGKKMDWEAVVKIPFIDEKRLLEAMAPKNELLSEDEKARNDFGVPLKFTYSENVDFMYPSSLVDVFPAIPHCHCVENIFDLPPVEGLDYRVGLTDGALLNVSALAGFPTLATLPYTATLGFHGVNVFQQDSRNESMVVNLLGTEERTRVEMAKVKLGQRCFVGYPFLQEAKVMKVSDELFDYVLAEDGQVIQQHHSDREIQDWNRKAEKIENFYSKRLGILIGQVESLVYVHMLRGLIKTDEGATVKEYGEIPGMETDYASQIIVDEVVNEDERFIEKAALPLEEEFPIKSVGFFLGEFNYGRPLEVAGYTNGKLIIWLGILEKPEADFARRIIQNAERGKHYLPSYMVAKQLDLHPLTLSKITSSYFVSTMGGLRVNLGLNLKFEAKKQKVLGYSRKSGTGWEFSPAAVHLIVEYMTKFPDFFAGVKRNPSGSELSELDLWSDPATASARVKEIGAWLKTLKTSSMDRVPLDAEQLDSDVVMQLAQEADNLEVSEIPQKPTKMNGVPRNALVRPEDAEHRLGNQRFNLGDRVVYVAQTGKVPIAFRGTVVGISRTPTAKLLDVVFDVTFMSGTTLGDRCPPFRGQTVPSTTLLNLSDRQVVAGSKATLARQPISPSVTTLTAHGGYGMQSHGRHYQDAAAPPPLQGSWRGAVNGSHRGRGRGDAQSQPQRGSLNIMHSSLVYRPHPDQGPGQNRGQYRGNGRGNGRGRGGRGGGAAQPNGSDSNVNTNGTSTPPSGAYSAVPPPSNLDAPRGGRGRGRGGRGRGGENRGRGGRGGAGANAATSSPQAATSQG
ncbi:XRN 5'-3' exonuclease N-terminus-domain-containing protein [Diplogelasinospora grovesii]|uniref:5'-3' exoribonuclease 1 n=1 Tax=Diplogelasinospora grovesii TaxID=303347 RepID=A0AAN6S929_9PEZI|nr:XRN 5'-3' exonuclease N-terminus-domain-containing protein [Diplogelasinospora grovesii]